MPKARALTEGELRRLRPLEKKLRAAARRGDLRVAKEIAGDIQGLLRIAGDETRLQKAKAWLYEAALEAGELEFAVSGFIGIRGRTRPSTRIYLEATGLLAVCYLRLANLEAAKPLISESFQRVGNINSGPRKRQFYRRLIERFEEEWAIAVLAMGMPEETLDPERVQNEAGMLVATTPEDEILQQLGRHLPKQTADLLLEVYRYSHKQLPSAERLLLPSPDDKRRSRELGSTVFRSAKRAVWKALCDPTTDTYKMWFENGIMVAMDRKVVGASVVSALTGLGIGVYAFAVPIAALLIKLGVDVFCETCSAGGLMIGLDE
ncbi:MAG: hypothetical protein AVDCRST_MAG68-1425 [uncultured Gemmatimonadetes bacterium]|uniref:Uncharacterized protein n=1 Tax=uncultured Gemmatimonadota bacterium TaxID=203437 RepID=A0A6J4KQH2_9BACT|nr:MAG: hypothetical protein AVDCRST_MAG68-1425 [uncultured Gemmatimonadota bacterium]